MDPKHNNKQTNQNNKPILRNKHNKKVQEMNEIKISKIKKKIINLCYNLTTNHLKFLRYEINKIIKLRDGLEWVVLLQVIKP